VQPELPGVAVCLHHLRLARHVLVVVVRDVALAHEGLEVGPEPHAVRRVHVDHLHLPAERFIVEQRIHDRQRIAEDHAVHPVVAVFVGAQHLLMDRPLRVGEQLEQAELLVRAMTLERLEDGAR
jgi:hypothetical protein